MAKTIHHEVVACVTIYAPHWFLRKDFQYFLMGLYADPEMRARDPKPDNRVATWYRPRDVINEETIEDMYVDVFVTYDSGEGSDFESMPEDIWQEIHGIVQARGLKDCIVRIQSTEAYISENPPLGGRRPVAYECQCKECQE